MKPKCPSKPKHAFVWTYEFFCLSVHCIESSYFCLTLFWVFLFLGCWCVCVCLCGSRRKISRMFELLPLAAARSRYSPNGASLACSSCKKWARQKVWGQAVPWLRNISCSGHLCHRHDHQLCFCVCLCVFLLCLYTFIKYTWSTFEWMLGFFCVMWLLHKYVWKMYWVLN